MTPPKFDFWQDHSKTYLEMACQTERIGCMQNPDGYGKRKGECGDTIEMFINVRDDYIQAVSFMINGCINTVACANTAALLAEGKTVAQAWEISVENIIAYLETLPSQDSHCAELAVGALYMALSDYIRMKKEPWKRIYKK